MKLTTILAYAYIAAISGLLGYYYRECKRLKKQNEIQAEKIDTMAEYIRETQEQAIDRMKFWEE